MNTFNFASVQAIANMTAIERHIFQHGPAAAGDIGAGTGLTAADVSRYLKHMRYAEIVMTAPIVRGARGARKWMLGADQKVQVEHAKFLAANRPVVKAWAPNHYRMDLVAALFGEAAIPRSAWAGA